MKPVRLMKPHPAAALFPLLCDEELRELVEDIRRHDVRQPVVTFRGELLDGRNRIRACDLLGRDPPSVEYEGDDPVGFVISANLRRRHMDDGQRALVAAKLATLRQGARTDLSPIGEKSQAEAAHLLNVSKRSVERAREVLDHGAPELVAAVERGEASMSAAAMVASLPIAEQVNAVRLGTVAAVAKQIRKPVVIDSDARVESVELESPAEATDEGAKPRTPPSEADRAAATASTQRTGPSRSRRTKGNPSPTLEVAGYGEHDAELDDLRGAVETLTGENERLTAENTELRQAVALAILPDDERLTAKVVINELRAEAEGLQKELTTAKTTLNAVTVARDRYMDENAQLKRQCRMQRKNIAALKGASHGAA